jgi:DNA-binding transcriptional LysR family regulator
MYKSGLIELDAVVAVARLGGFRVAATELGMSSTALSNAVAGLEARLGVRLFNRTTRSVSLSAAGEGFVSAVAPALADIRQAMETVNRQRSTPTGTLRLNCSVGAAHQILGPVALEYLRRYPEMKVDIVTEALPIDMVSKGFDAGIRTVDTVPGDMIAVPLGPALRFVVVGSPAYFRDNPKPRIPGDLMKHRCIRARWPTGAIYRWEFEQRGKAFSLDVPGTLTLDESSLMREAAMAGAGLAYLWEAPIVSYIAGGQLVRVLEKWTPPSPGLSLYYPGRRNLPAALRTFIALAREVCGAKGAGGSLVTLPR